MTETVDTVETPEEVIVEAQDSSEASEPMIPQSKVNEIAAKARQAGRDQALKQFEAKMSEQNSSSNVADEQASSPAPSNLSADQVQAMIEEAASRKAQQEQEQRQHQQAYEIGQHLYTTFKDAEDNLPGFKEVTKDVDLTAMPDVLGLLYENARGNEAHALKELIENPIKLGTIRNMLGFAPARAAKEVQKLVGSIEANNAAKDAPSAPKPLSQLDGSTLGVDSGGRSVRDLRNNPKYSW